MKNKYKIIGISLLLMLTLFTSCQHEEKIDETKVMNTENMEVKPEINLYLDGTGNNYWEVLIEQFKYEHPEVKVNITDYSKLAPDEYRTKLSSELMVGKGPDVLLVINDGNETTDYMPDMLKMIQNNVFMDVNELEIDFSECNQTVMKAGVYKDKQVIVPLNYSLGFLYSTVERMEKAGVDYYDGMTLEEFSAQFPTFYRNNPEKKAFIHYLGAQFLFPHNGIQLIDYNTNEFLSVEKGLDIMGSYTKCFDNLFPNLFDSTENVMDYMFYRNVTKYGNSDPDIYHSGDLLFLSGRGFQGNFETISMLNYNVYNIDVEKSETPVMFPMPTITGKMAAPRITYYLVVNANTTNTYSVEKFIDTAIGKDFQYTTTGAGILINQELMEYMHEYYLSEGYDPAEKYIFAKNCEFDKAFVEKYFEYINNMSEPIFFMDRTSSSYIFSIVRNGILDNSTFEDMYKSAKSQLEFYLGE